MRNPCNLPCCSNGSYEFLYHQRIVLKRTPTEIGELLGRSSTHIKKRLKYHNIYKPRSEFPVISKGGRKRSNPIWNTPLSILFNLDADMLAERFGVTRSHVYKVRKARAKEIKSQDRAKESQ